MSLAVNTSMSASPLLMQLQQMHQQMNMLSRAAQGPVGAMQNHQLNNLMAPGVEDVPQAQQAQGVSAAQQAGGFADLLKQAFEGVNSLQNTASDAQTKFDLGDKSMSLADVMLASQKANISFEATIQVRNKMVEAYRTISQMQI